MEGPVANLPCGYFPSSGMNNWNRYTQPFTSPSHWLPDLCHQCYYAREGQQKPLELPLSRNIENQKLYHISEDSVNITATIK